MGGMIGFQLGVDRPELLRSLTIVNSGPEVKPKTPRDYWEIARRWTLSRLMSLDTIAKALARLLFPALNRPSCDARWKSAGRRTTSVPTSPPSTPSSVGACGNASAASPVLRW